MNKEKDKAKGGSMIGKIIFEVIKFLITAFIITNIVNKSYLHFATVTGYDEEKVYLADSIQSWVNVDKDGKAIEPALDTAPTSGDTTEQFL